MTVLRPTRRAEHDNHRCHTVGTRLQRILTLTSSLFHTNEGGQFQQVGILVARSSTPPGKFYHVLPEFLVTNLQLHGFLPSCRKQN